MARLKPVPPAGVCSQLLQDHQLMPTNVPACKASSAGSSCGLGEGKGARRGEALSAAPSAAQGTGQRLWGESGSPNTINWTSAGMGLPAFSKLQHWFGYGMHKGVWASLKPVMGPATHLAG